MPGTKEENMIYRYFKNALTLVIFSLLALKVDAQDVFSEPPIATNTINSVRLSELNLTGSDYTVMNTITETSLISVEHSRKGFKIYCEDEDFKLEYRYEKTGEAQLIDWEGVVKLGFLSNDDVYLYTPKRPADIAAKLAVYKMINAAQMNGADGVIEPTISMNMARNGKLHYYKTTVSCKLIKLIVKE